MGASSSLAIKLYTDQIYGHRITVFSVPSGSDYVPTLLIDGAVPSCVGLGTCTNVGAPEPAGTMWSIPVTVVEPNQPANSSCASGVTACKTLTIAAGGSYLVSTGTGQVGRGMPEYHRQLLAQARAAGNADTSELVLGESLAVIGYTWLAEFSAAQQMTDQLSGTTTLYYFGVGITAQANIQQSGYQGPYVDLPLNVVGITPQISNGPTTTIGAYTYPTSLVSAFFSDGETISAFESAVLEQTQAPVSGMTAASTIKIIDANMNPSYSGALQQTFFADGTTSAGQSAYTDTIEPAISSHYSSADLSTINSLVSGGAQVLIPENGQLAVGVWTGAGYTEIFPQSSNAITITQKITGGMSGGFSGTDIPDPTDDTQVTLPPAASTDTVVPILVTIPGLANPLSFEPVDAVTGAYIYQHNDLTTGSDKFPYALPFSRTYLSSSGSHLTTTTADAGMGNGWAHNYSTTAQVESDPYIGVGGSDSPAVSAATSIAALYVMQDLLSVTPTAQTMTTSSMAARWFTDQLTSNVVMVQQPNTTEEFVALPHADDATAYAYNPQPGSAVQFTQIAAGQYTYARKDAVTLNFGPTPAGALQNWVFPNGVAINLSYSGTELTKISNNLGRSLSLTYNGSDIAAVTDDTGRSVNYGYDGNHNLTSFSDPLSATTSYAHDTSGTYDTFGHLTQVFYPFRPGNPYVTNWYDPLGRVIQQANANGYISNFYFAGSRSELVDAAGNRHVTYQTDRGKVLTDAYVLNSGFGDVFNDTAQQNGVVNVTTNQYDGLDRLTLTTLPEGGTTAFSYAAAVNPWANNIASVTRTAKPGSPLSPLTTSFAYDPIYNKPTQITDPLGLIAQMNYDPATGNLLSATADAGGTGHFNATRRFTYDAHGKVLSETDPLGDVTAFSYDSFENVLAQVSDSGGAGHLNLTTRYAHDALGDVVARTDPDGNTSTMTYDADRRVLMTTAPAPFNSGPLLVQTTNTYDPDGRLLIVARANGSNPVVTNTSYTATGQVQSVTDANGNVTTNAYDADDRLATVTDPLRRLTIYGYDAMSRRITVSNPAIQPTPLLQQSYTPDGLIGSLTDANGNATTFTLDGFDRLSTTTYPDSSAENLSYDADGNVLSRQTRAGATISFSYDTLNRLSTKAAPSEATVSYAYDQASHLIGVTDNSASIATPAASASYVENLSYDQLSRPLTVTWSPVQPQAPPSASTSVTFSFAYDATNRRVSQSATDSSWWSYPTAATNVSYTPNNLNQYTAVGSVSPTYDGNGNLHYDGTFTYGYDAENRLISASGPGLTASYAYDAQRRRKSKTVNGTTTIYVTDADNREVLEYDGTSGTIHNWYAYALGPNDVLNQINVGASTRATFIPDIQGSFIGALDAVSGSLTKFGYQTYGESISSNSSFAYTGQRIDPETNGLYYYRARMYSPAWGRFMQVDPVGFQSGNNLYRYVGNDPLDLTDPSGLAGILFSFGGTVDAGSGSTLLVNPDTGQPTNAPTGFYATGTGTVGGFVNTNAASGNYLGATVGGAVTVGGGTYGLITANGATSVATAAFPQNQPSIIGGGISKGVTVSYTTANDISELAGTSTVTEYNLGLLQFQSSSGTNAAGQAVNTYSLGLCLCIGVSNYATQTYPPAPITPGIPLPALSTPGEAAEATTSGSSGAAGTPGGSLK